MATLISHPGPVLSYSPLLHSGTYMIYGTIKNTGTPNFPVYRKLNLHETRTGQLVNSLFSDSITGEYAFKYIAHKSYYIVSFDHTGQYNGVIATNIFPTLMP